MRTHSAVTTCEGARRAASLAPRSNARATSPPILGCVSVADAALSFTGSMCDESSRPGQISYLFLSPRLLELPQSGPPVLGEGLRSLLRGLKPGSRRTRHTAWTDVR